MKRKAILACLTALLLLTAAACGAGGGSSVSNGSAASGGSAQWNGAMTDGGELGFDASLSPESMAAEPQAAPDAAGDALMDAKLIRTAELELETTAFDESVSKIEALVNSMGGYLENSDLYTGGSSRWASYTVRVPADRFQPFLDQVGELCHLVRQNASAKNITEVYYDTQGRLKTQQIKLERLQTLLAKAELMEDIITLESAISETEYQIESLSGELRHYDDLVNYSTIHISLSEVYRLTAVEEVPDSFASRLGTAFTSGLGSFGEWLENLAVALAYSWIWLVLLVLIVFLVVRVMKKRRQDFFPPRDKNDPKN